MKLSVTVVLAALALASVWSASAGASSPSATAAVLRSGEAQDESAGSEEEPEAREGEAEEEPQGGESETGGGEATRHARKHASECVVPSVKGNTLAGARRVLLSAHCSLGRVYAPHSGHGALLLVTWQSASSGSRLRGGSSVSLRLAPRTRHH